MKITHEAGKYVLYKEKTVIGTAALEDGRLWVEIDPAWRQRGYGSYLVKEILQQNGGYDVKRETRFTAGPAADEAAGGLIEKVRLSAPGRRDGPPPGAGSFGGAALP